METFEIKLTREELKIILKHRLQNIIDLRYDNPYATYYDQTGKLEWKNSYFNSLTAKQLVENINKICRK